MNNQSPGATKARMSHNWKAGVIQVVTTYQVIQKLKAEEQIREVTNSVSFHLPTDFKKFTSSDTYPTHANTTHAAMEMQAWMDVENQTQLKAAAETPEEFCKE